MGEVDWLKWVYRQLSTPFPPPPLPPKGLVVEISTNVVGRGGRRLLLLLLLLLGGRARLFTRHFGFPARFLRAGDEGFRNVPEEEANFSNMDVKLEDVERPFFTGIYNTSDPVKAHSK